RDGCKQLHVSRRSEKVSPEEVCFKIFGSILRHQMDWDARCVGSHQGSRVPKVIHFCEYAPIDVQSFYDYFDDPIRIGDLVQIIFKITYVNSFGEFLRIEWGGA